MQRLFLLITTALPQSKQKQRILWQVLPYLPLGKGEAAKKDSPRTRDTIETEEAGCRAVVWEKGNPMHLPHTKG